MLCFDVTALCPASQQGMSECSGNTGCESSLSGAVNVLVLEKFLNDRESRDWF